MSMDKITLETVKLVQQYIKERDYDNLKHIIESISGINLNCSLVRTSEQVYLDAVVSLIFDLVFTDPDFFDNDKMRNMFEKMVADNSNILGNISKTYLYGATNLYFTFRYIEMVLNKDKNMLKTLGIIGRLSDAITLESLLYDILNISTDDMILEAITDILENSTTWLVKSVQSSDIIYEWLWLYMTAIIRQNRFDLLDRAVEVIYKSDYKNFLSKIYFSNDGFSFTKYVKFLFERYAPEISKEQLRELFVSSNYLDKAVRAYFSKMCDSKISYEEMMEDLVNDILEIGVKFKIINSLMGSGMIFDQSIDESILQKIFDEEETILYIGTNSYFMNYNYEWMLQYVSNHPECIISIDNFECSNRQECYNGLCINNTQFKKLLRGRKLSLTDKVSENNCLNELIKGNAKILPLVIASLEPDAQMYEELIDLCVKYNNIKALNTVNNVYKK